MTWTVIVVGLVACTAVGVLAGRQIRRRPGRWVSAVLGGSVVVAGLLFVPVRCATGVPASAVTDVTDEAPPTGCTSLARVDLPRIGLFAGDTVGYGLAVLGAGATLGAALLAMGSGRAG